MQKNFYIISAFILILIIIGFGFIYRKSIFDTKIKEVNTQKSFVFEDFYNDEILYNEEVKLSDELKSKIESELNNLINLEESEGYKNQQLIALKYKILGNYQEAYDIFDELLKNNPESLELKMEWADLLRVMQQYQDTAKIYEDIINNNPDNVLAHLRLIDLYKNYNKRDDRIRAVYQRALFYTNENVDLLKYYAGYLQNVAKDYPEALKYWRKALLKTNSKSIYDAIQKEIEYLENKIANNN